ncbi:MAG: hypothetical protein RBU25_10710, partial [Lentisphaeria bacterium]|nr:hypothetical protein [Lentisphaeria bacterium]
WYKEFFSGELRHRFVVLPYAGNWQTLALPTRCRALATGPRQLESAALVPGLRTLAKLSPDHVHLAGIDAARRRIVLAEWCGLPADYRLELDGKVYTGNLQPFGVAELDIQN